MLGIPPDVTLAQRAPTGEPVEVDWTPLICSSIGAIFVLVSLT